MSDGASKRARSLLDRMVAFMLNASVLERIGIAVLSALSALSIGVGIVFVLSSLSADTTLLATEIETGPATFVDVLIQGSLGSESAQARTLRFTTMFVLTGVAVAVAFRAGVFNIGVQGQFVVGGFTTVISILWLAPMFPSNAIGGVILIIMGTAMGAISGGAYGALPGILKAYADANEIITTIMLNFVATGVVGWLVEDPFRGEGQAAALTDPLPEHVEFPRLLFDSPSFSIIGVVIALVVAVLIALLLSRTRLGYDMVTSGYQQSAATYSGVDAKRNIVTTMTISGAVAGVAGSVYAIMIRGDYVDPGTINTFGFDAIAVSLLGANNPLAVIPAGLLFGALDSAGSGISLGTNLPPTLIDGIIGLVVLFVAAPELFRTLGRFTNLGGERP
jgi:simple sugar transport system permease protein